MKGKWTDIDQKQRFSFAIDTPSEEGSKALGVR